MFEKFKNWIYKKSEEKLVLNIVKNAKILGWDIMVHINQGDDTVTGLTLGTPDQIDKIALMLEANKDG